MIKKFANIPQLLILESSAATLGKDKAELFSNYFVSIFNDQDEIRITSTNASLNTVNCLEKKCLALKNLKKRQVNWARQKRKPCSEKMSPNNWKTPSHNRSNLCQQRKISHTVETLSSDPIFKEGNRADVSCYRPITLLCCCSKVFEKIPFDEIYEFVKGTLNPSQFGFRRKRSATLQLLMFLDKVYNYNDVNIYLLIYIYLL